MSKFVTVYGGHRARLNEGVQYLEYPKYGSSREDMARRTVYSDETYSIVMPDSVFSIIAESRAMCLDAEWMIDHVIEGKGFIAFLCGNEDPGTPLVFLWMNTERTAVKMSAGKNNRRPDADEQKFLDKFQENFT